MRAELVFGLSLSLSLYMYLYIYMYIYDTFSFVSTKDFDGGLGPRFKQHKFVVNVSLKGMGPNRAL